MAEDTIIEADISIEPMGVPSGITSRAMWVIFSYFALITLLLGLGDGLVSLPVSFYLKDTLKLSSQQMAFFGVLVGFPSSIGFLFGFLRDRLRPFGWGDRGYLLLTALSTAAAYVTLCFLPLTYTTLLIVAMIAGVIGSLRGAAFGGLTASVAQRHLISGRLTAVATFIGVFPGVASSLLGGFLTEKVAPQVTFGICAGLMILVACLSFWRPAAVFDGEPERHPRTVESLSVAMRRLVQYRPLRPALLLQFLWLVMPGWGTPLFFYMTNTVKLTPQQVGVVQSTVPLCNLGISLLYGVLCRRLPLRTLLWIGVIAGVIGAPSAMLIKTYLTAILIFATAIALFGIGNCALNDLQLRSYPKGLEGTGATLMSTVGGAASVGANLFGAWLYDKQGFGPTMAISTLCTALMLPVLLFVPPSVTATRDGEQAEESSGERATIAL